MKAIGYIRVSTEGQAVDGVSLSAQRERIAAWCQVNGFELIATHADEGISGGGMTKRPGVQAAIDAACSEGAALVVYSLSRLARSTADAIAVADRLEQSGADLVSLSEKIDTTTACGKMVFRMLAVLAEFERDLVSERTTAALQHKKAQGQRVGTIPYGWTVADDGTTLLEHADEQRVIDTARGLRTSGFTLAKVQAALTAQDMLNRKGKPFSLPAIHKLTAA
jgi:DNA invertase Pin-like site-specific DNA recombinase